MKHQDEKFLERALKLAAKGGRAVAPNPMVGAVIVKDGVIVGEGYHKEFGGPHAEVIAINAVKDPEDLKDATLYVTLEPCRHFGKTPPCQQLIEKVGITRVVCGSKDPFQKRGKAIFHSFLTGSGAEPFIRLNKFFFTWVTKKRPYITVKIAVSADGFVAGQKGESVRITSPTQDKKVHQLRAQHQAILIGSNTALLDNPRLNVRLVRGKDPLRIILDSKRKVPKTSRVFADQNYLHIKKRVPLKALMRDLAKQNIASILVEPGPRLYEVFKKEGLIDELIVFRGSRKIKEGIAITL